MILLWGIPSEPPLAMAARAAQDRGIAHIVVNQRRCALYDLVVDEDGGGHLTADDRETDLSELTGIYVRIMDFQDLHEYRDGTADARERIDAFHALLLAHCDTTAVRVANPTDAMASNGSKPYQMQMIREAGFDVPHTLVTNDPAEVAHFEAEEGELIFKSTSSERSIVRRLDALAKRRLDAVRRLPVQFQRLEKGTNVRVHVVGREVFAAEATTNALDYRYASADGEDLELRRVDLPDGVAQHCVDLAQALRLPFCGIDLLRRTDGSWVCFEVNPSPGYSWYAEQADLPIAEALVAWLASGWEY